MARPVQPLGTFGTIRVETVAPRAHVASARYRNFDGSYSRVQVTETTRKRAENALKAKLSSYLIDNDQEDITRLTRLTDVAALWLEELRLEERVSPQTIEKYDEILRSVVLEPLGNLRLQELTVGTIDRFLKALASSASPSRASLAKTVLSRSMALAVRHDAIPINPVLQTGGVRKSRKEIRALTLEELEHIRRILREWRKGEHVPGPKPDPKLAQIFDVILGTSARIGEVVAIRRRDIDLDADDPTITISGTVIRLRGKGLIRQEHPKHSKHWRVVTVPEFTAAAARQRLDELGPIPADQTIFCTKGSGLLAPANVRRLWREIRAGSDLPEGLDLSSVTPHTFRKTVATELTNRVDVHLAAELLGHSSTVITEEFYVQPKKTINPATAVVLASLGPQEIASS
jgi:integrase